MAHLQRHGQSHGYHHDGYHVLQDYKHPTEHHPRMMGKCTSYNLYRLCPRNHNGGKNTSRSTKQQGEEQQATNTEGSDCLGEQELCFEQL